MIAGLEIDYACFRTGSLREPQQLRSLGAVAGSRMPTAAERFSSRATMLATTHASHESKWEHRQGRSMIATCT
jgi:hypothetical protein